MYISRYQYEGTNNLIYGVPGANWAHTSDRGTIEA